MDFRQAVIDALDRQIAAGKVNEHIEAAVASSLKHAIGNLLGDYGPFTKHLEEALKQSLALNGSLDLPSYNDAVLKIVRQKVERAMQGSIEREVEKQLTYLLEPAPASIRLSELVAQYREYLKERLRGGCHCHDADYRIKLRVGDRSLHGYKEIELWETRTDKSSPDIRIATNGEGTVYSLSFKHFGSDNPLFSGPLYGFQRRLFQMRVAGTRIEFDENASLIDDGYSPEELTA